MEAADTDAISPAPVPVIEGPDSGLDFGRALAALKRGLRVSREGWNGKGMWLVLIKAGNAMHTSRAGRFDMQDCIGMKTAQGTMQPGWLASQADLLAEDWTVLQEAP